MGSILHSVRRDSRFLWMTLHHVVFDLVNGHRDRRRRFMEHLLLFDYNERAQAAIHTMDLQDLCPGAERIQVTLQTDRRTNGEVSPLEIDTLSRLAKYLHPARIFEIGTFTGNTTLHLALNTDSECRIHTLDLPWSDIDHVKFSVEGQESHIKKNVIGECFLSHPVRPRIDIHLGDSATFDYSRFAEQMDLVFVDGSHTYDCVASDTANAFSMLSPNGVIIWHDFLNIYHQDVTRFLFELAERCKVFHIRGTNLALYSRRFLPPEPSNDVHGGAALRSGTPEIRGAKSSSEGSNGSSYK